MKLQDVIDKLEWVKTRMEQDLDAEEIGDYISEMTEAIEELYNIDSQISEAYQEMDGTNDKIDKGLYILNQI